MTFENTKYFEVLKQSENSIREKAALVRSIIDHNGEKGQEMEEVFRSELRRILPNRFGITIGFVVDSLGGQSKQLNIIIYDALNTSPIFVGDGRIIIPAECTYAAGEIKTHMGKDEISDCFEKCWSFKSLDRSAQFIKPTKLEVLGNKTEFKPEYHLYGSEIDRITNFWPPLFFSLAYETDTLETFHGNVINALKEYQSAYSILFYQHMNFMGAITPSPISNQNPKGCTPVKIFAKQTPAGEVENVNFCNQNDQTWSTYPAKYPWVLFVSLFNTVITQAPQTSVNMKEYLGNIAF